MNKNTLLLILNALVSLIKCSQEEFKRRIDASIEDNISRKRYVYASDYENEDKFLRLSLMNLTLSNMNFLPTGGIIKIHRNVIKIISGRTTILTLKGHTKPVTAAVYLPDNYLASADSTCIKIWNLNTGTCVRTLQTEVPTKCLLSLPDGYLASAGDSLIMTIWELKTGRIESIVKLKYPAKSLICSSDDIMAYTPGTSAENQKLAIYKLETKAKESSNCGCIIQ